VISESDGNYPVLEDSAVMKLAKMLRVDARTTGSAQQPRADSAAYEQYLEAMGYLHRWGLRLVQRESNPGYYASRPIQRLCRAAATENHEIIGVVDNLGMENLTPSGDPTAWRLSAPPGPV
jgi:hypothetical protein